MMLVLPVQHASLIASATLARPQAVLLAVVCLRAYCVSDGAWHEMCTSHVHSSCPVMVTCNADLLASTS